MNWKAFQDFLIARFSEKTTWAGAITFVTTFAGMAIEPKFTEQIAVGGSALGSLLLVLLKEKGSEK